MFDLIVIGHLLKEKVVFPDGRELGPVLGSPAAYSSCAVARLGLKVGLVSRAGRDMPEELLSVFSEVGVDTRGLKMGETTTSNRLIYQESGDKRLEFLTKAADISFQAIPEEYLNASFFLIAPVDYEVPESLLQSLHRKGKRLSMELSGFGGASSSEDGRIPRDERIDYLRRITPCFEIIKAGQEDCQCLFGDACPEEITGKFLSWGAKAVAITLKEKGAVLSDPYGLFRVPSLPTEAVDTTGAGDAWHAGFLAEYIKGKSLKESAEFANAVASLVIAKSGGVVGERFPTYQEAVDFIRQTWRTLSSSRQVSA